MQSFSVLSVGPPLPPQQWHLVDEIATFIPLPHSAINKLSVSYQGKIMYFKNVKCITNTKNVLKKLKMY
jgi:hypothetical protein